MTTSLQQGIDAAKAGLMEEALTHLKDAIVEEPENANVWVWLAAIIEDEEKQAVFLRKALEIDPANRPAQRGLAFIERKKYIPPKPGEKLSDYTKPIGVFKTPISPAQAAANVSESVNSDMPEVKPTQQPEPWPTPPQSAAPKPDSTLSRKPLADVAIYGLTLMVFVIIGILIGTTLLNFNLPFLQKPTPVLTSLPPSEGVFLLQNGEYLEMKLNLNDPTSLEGIPTADSVQPEIVVNTLLVTMERLKFMDQDGNPVPFDQSPAQENAILLRPQSELTAGRYCLVYTLNQDKNESLYWCLQVN